MLPAGFFRVKDQPIVAARNDRGVKNRCKALLDPAVFQTGDLSEPVQVFNNTGIILFQCGNQAMADVIAMKPGIVIAFVMNTRDFFRKEI